MTGFPIDNSEDFDDSEEIIEATIRLDEEQLGRPLTASEKLRIREGIQTAKKAMSPTMGHERPNGKLADFD